MGLNSTDISYHFGQMGSGHIKASAWDLKPPHGRVIVAIQCLESVAFSHLEPDTSYSSTLVDSSDSYGDGIGFIGTTNGDTRAHGLDNSDSSAESVNIASTVIFPTGTILYGRWKRVSLNSNMTHGIIVYYGK